MEQNKKAKIYTKQGDNKETRTVAGKVLKSDLVIFVEGAVDELQTSIMLARSFFNEVKYRDYLEKITRLLFTLSYSIVSEKDLIEKEDILDLEKEIDLLDSKLPPLNDFILPGFSKAAALVHNARTTTRKTERLVVKYALEHKVDPKILQYLNRLSDYFFVLGRYVDLGENNGWGNICNC